jgi:hypothetical protein
MSAHPAIASAAIQRFFPRSDGSTPENYREISNTIDSGTKPDYITQQWHPNSLGFKVITTKTTPVHASHVHPLSASIEPEEQMLHLVLFSEARNYVGISEYKVLARENTPKRLDVIRDLEGTPELSSYLLKIYNLEKNCEHRAASKIVFQFIETRFSASNLAAVNALLEAIDLSKLSAYSIAGLVRFTSRAKNHLPYWATLFAQARKTLTEKGYNTEEVLMGIKG